MRPEATFGGSDFGFASEAQFRLFMCLVRDFEYLKRPTYGHAPLRHQHYWTVATAGLSGDQVEEALGYVVRGRDADGEDTLLTLIGSLSRIRDAREAA